MQPTNSQPSTEQKTNQRATVSEAAVILGISEDAVRSRLKRGTLRKEKGADGTVFVVLGTSETNDQPTPSQPTDQSALIESLRDQVNYLREQLDKEREANHENRRIIMALTQRIPELEPAAETSSDARESPVTASEEPSRGKTPEEQEEPKKRPWWQRIFGI